MVMSVFHAYFYFFSLFSDNIHFSMSIFSYADYKHSRFREIIITFIIIVTLYHTLLILLIILLFLVRKVIYTTNAIESLNSTYRKLNRQRSVFPSDTALLKALYLATFEATKNGLPRYETGHRSTVS